MEEPVVVSPPGSGQAEQDVASGFPPPPPPAPAKPHPPVSGPSEPSQGGAAAPPLAAPDTPVAGASTARPAGPAGSAKLEPAAGGAGTEAGGPGRSTSGRRLGLLPPSVYLLGALGGLGAVGLCLAAPGLAARSLFRRDAAQPLDAQHHSLGRLDGGAVLVDAGVMAALALPLASWRGMGERSADLAKLSLLARGVTDTLNSIFYSHAVWPPLVIPFILATAAGMAPAWDLLVSGRGRGLLRELSGRLARPRPGGRSVLAWAHYLLAWAAPLTGGALLTFWPQFATYHLFGYSYGASAFLMAALAGAAIVFPLPITNLLLKDAATNGTLGSRPARLLNTGQMLAAVVHLAVLVPKLMEGSPGGWMLPAYTATWALTLATSAAGLLAGSAAPGGGRGEKVARAGQAAGEGSLPAGSKEE